MQVRYIVSCYRTPRCDLRVRKYTSSHLGYVRLGNDSAGHVRLRVTFRVYCRYMHMASSIINISGRDLALWVLNDRYSDSLLPADGPSFLAS